MAVVGPVRSDLSTQPREPAMTPCRASCCKSPFGHSTVRDQYPVGHPLACRCHSEGKN